MFPGNFLKGRCTQCTDGTYREVVEICTCGIELCKKHTFFHTQKHHMKIPVNLQKVNESINICIDRKYCIENFKTIVDLVRNQMMEHYVNKICKRKDTECMHFFYMNNIPWKAEKLLKETNMYYDVAQCCLCSNTDNRWFCLACSLVFCGRKRYSAEGNQHARVHFESTGHSIFLSIDLINCDKKMYIAFCQLCARTMHGSILECFVESRYAFKQASCTDISNNGDMLTTYQGPKKKIADLLQKSFSVHDYVFSAFQALSFALFHSDPLSIFEIECEDTQEHAEIALEIRNIILQFFLCFSSPQVPTHIISIEKICSIILNEIPEQKKNTDIDVGAFIRTFLSFVRKRKILDSILQFSSSFSISLRLYITCQSCKSKKEKIEQIQIIYLKREQSLLEYFSFKEFDAKCICGRDTRITRTIFSNIPCILVVKSKKVENNMLGSTEEKIPEKEISVPYILSNTKNNEDSINSTVKPNEISEGFFSFSISTDIPFEIREHIKRVMYARREKHADIKKKYQQQKTGFLKYTLASFVVHQNNLAGGYYMAQTKRIDKSKEETDWDIFINSTTLLPSPFFLSDAVFLFYILE